MAKKANAKKEKATESKELKEELQRDDAEGLPPVIDQDEIENLEEQAEAAHYAKSVAAEAASAALGSPKSLDAAPSLKNFRNHPDMENFYRFIYENDLRYEALQIIDGILLDKQNRKKLRVEKAKIN